MKIDANRRSVDLDPRDAQFYANPYPIYQRLHQESQYRDHEAGFQPVVATDQGGDARSECGADWS